MQHLEASFIFIFQERYSWFSHLSLQIKIWKDTFSATVTANSIHLTGGTWELFNVNLIIKDAHLKNFRLVFTNDLKYRNNETTKGLNLTLENTYYTFPEYIGPKPLIQIINSNAIFANTTITHVHGNESGTIIYATMNSKLKLSNCEISKIAEIFIFVSVFNFTAVYIETCILQNNKAEILFQSQVNCYNVVNGSVFAENGPENVYGKCFAVSNNTKIDIFNSTFHANDFQWIWGEYYTHVNISNSKFVGNNLESVTSSVKLFDHCYMSVENCEFFSNLAESSTVNIAVDYHVYLTVRDSLFFNNTGGTSASLLVSRSSAYIQNVTFINNSAIQGSCISLIGQSQVHVKNSKFQGNIVGPAVYVPPGSDLLFENCTFANHSSPTDSLIEIHNSQLKIIGCVIDSNKMGIKGGIVQATTSLVTVQRCKFRNNSGRYGTLFFLSRQSKLAIENSALHNNTGSIGGCVYITDSAIQVTETIFHNNKAVLQGGAIAGERYNITIKDSKFTNHSAGMGGVLFMVNGTFMANNSIFENNTSPGGYGAVVYKMFTGDLILDNCSLSMNPALLGTIWNFYYDNSILRLSNTNCTICTNCHYHFCLYFVVKHGYRLTVYTSNFNIDNEKIHISSSDINFVTKALHDSLITAEGDKIYWKELPFASGKTRIQNNLFVFENNC